MQETGVLCCCRWFRTKKMCLSGWGKKKWNFHPSSRVPEGNGIVSECNTTTCTSAAKFTWATRLCQTCQEDTASRQYVKLPRPSLLPQTNENLIMEIRLGGCWTDLTQCAWPVCILHAWHSTKAEACPKPVRLYMLTIYARPFCCLFSLPAKWIVVCGDMLSVLMPLGWWPRAFLLQECVAL